MIYIWLNILMIHISDLIIIHEFLLEFIWYICDSISFVISYREYMIHISDLIIIHEFLLEFIWYIYVTQYPSWYPIENIWYTYRCHKLLIALAMCLAILNLYHYPSWWLMSIQWYPHSHSQKKESRLSNAKVLEDQECASKDEISIDTVSICMGSL